MHATSAPPQPSTHPAPRRRTWPWAAGSIGTVALVLALAVAGRAVVARGHRVAAVVAPPAVPALAVATVARPEAGATLTALDPGAGHLVALAAPTWLTCPPPALGACPPAPTPDAFVVLDDATGRQLARTPLDGTASEATSALLLLADPATHRAYAIGSRTVSVFSTMTGASLPGYTLPAEAGASGAAGERVVGAALDPSGETLTLLRGNGTLYRIAATTGQARGQHDLPADLVGATLSGPLLDSAHNRLAVLAQPATGSAPLLLAYDVGSLQPTARFTLPAGARLGPLDAASDALYAFGGDGAVWQMPLTALAASGQGEAAPLMPQPSLRGALALGWDAAGRRYLATPGMLQQQGTASGNAPLAALPLQVGWTPSQPLPLDTTRGLLAVPTTDGALVLVRAGDGQATPLTPDAAVLLARAAMQQFLPDTNQDPPFVAPEFFPSGPGERAEEYYIHFADLGWQGPYPGVASVAVVPASSPSGAYTVTVHIAWHQLFDRQHSWTCLVLADGGVRLTGQSGDAIP